MLGFFAMLLEKLSPGLLDWFLKQLEKIIGSYINRSDSNIDRLLTSIADKRSDFGMSHVELYQEMRIKLRGVMKDDMEVDNLTLYDLLAISGDIKTDFIANELQKFKEEVQNSLLGYVRNYIVNTEIILDVDVDTIFVDRLVDRVYLTVLSEYNYDAVVSKKETFEEMVLLRCTSSQANQSKFGTFYRNTINKMQRAIPDVYDSMIFISKCQYTPDLSKYTGLVSETPDNTVVFELIGRSPSIRGKVMFQQILKSTIPEDSTVPYEHTTIDTYRINTAIVGKNIIVDVTGITAFSGLVGLILSVYFFCSQNLNMGTFTLIIDKDKQLQQIQHALENETKTNINIQAI